MLMEYMKDYISIYRPSRIKQDWKDSPSTPFFAVYFSLLPIVSGGFNLESDGPLWRDWIILLAFMPMLLAFYSAWVYPVKLSKMMYLCPMDRKERRDYIYGAYHFRVGFHMILAVIGICILIPFFNCDMLSVVEILLNDLVIAIVIMSKQKTDDKWKAQAGELLNITMFIVAMYSNLAQMVFVSNEGSHILGKVIVLLVFCFIQLPLMLKYRKYVKRVLDAAVMFEGGRE